MNIGLPKGFIQFGTLQHKVLRYMHVAEYVGQRQLQEDIGGEVRHLSVTLARLHRHGYIYKVGRERPVGHRSYAVYSLNPSTHVPRIRRQSGCERSRTYRAKLGMKVPSVFNFRGEIHVADQSTARSA